MTYLAVEGRKQIYFEHFAGTGTGIALVHGWAVESRCWDGVLPSLLATGRPVITIDQRCCGRSDRDFADVSISALAADVVGVVEHLGLSRIVLNGWSLGGAVAVAAAPSRTNAYSAVAWPSANDSDRERTRSSLVMRNSQTPPDRPVFEPILTSPNHQTMLMLQVDNGSG